MQVKFQSNDFTEAFNLVDLGKQFDDDGSGRRVLDWLSAMINAFVDIAKDPYIVRLNVNQYTFNMTAYLLRMGKGEQTFYFLKQPVIEDVAKAVLNTRGNYGKDNTKTQYEIEQEATQKVLDSYGITKKVLEAQRELLRDPKELAIHLKGLFDGQLETMLLSDEISDDNRKAFQAKVWLAWQALTPYAKDMADLVKYSKVDTKKMGKSFAAQRIFEKGMDRMSLWGENRFEDGVIKDFFDNTFLSTKANNSIVFGRSLFENQLLRTSPKFIKILDNILYRLGKDKNVDEGLLRTIVGSMEAAIKSEYFNRKMEEKGIKPADFFYGENTIARRLMKLRNRVYRGELNDLKNSTTGFDNALLNFLIPNNVKYETTFVEPDYVDVKTMFDQDVHTKNMIITSWEELLQHHDAEVRDLAEDLIYYAFLTSGDNKNMNSFFEFVPTSWRGEYSQFLQDKLDNNETYVNYRDVFLNNWTNNDIVPRIEYTYREERITQDGEVQIEEQMLDGVRAKWTFPGTTAKPYLFFVGATGNKLRIKPIGHRLVAEMTKIGMVNRSYPIYPSFVKIRYCSNNAPSSFMTYELIGYNTVRTKDGNVTYKPIYMAVNKKGYRHKGHVITEYGNYHGHAFNLNPIGVTKKDFINGNIVKLIEKSSILTAEQKTQYSKSFGKFFNDINKLPSFQGIDSDTNQAILDRIKEVVQSNPFDLSTDISEQMDYKSDIAVNDYVKETLDSLINNIPSDNTKASPFVSKIMQVLDAKDSKYLELNNYNQLIISNHRGPSSEYAEDILYTRIVLATSQTKNGLKLKDSDAYSIEYVFTPTAKQNGEFTTVKLEHLKNILRLISNGMLIEANEYAIENEIPINSNITDKTLPDIIGEQNKNQCKGG